ncbi:DUF4489 domain-containing protein [Lachnospiraceae bacterium 54-53]
MDKRILTGGDYQRWQKKDCNCSCICERPRKRPKPNRATLKCGCQGGGVTLPEATVASAAFILTTLNVDTKSYRRPCVKFNFASNIVTTAAVITLNFQIFKQCKGQLTPVPVGPVWTFSRLVAVTESNSFSFFVCDCDICNDECCLYSVVATVVGIEPTIDQTLGDTAINNAFLSAIIVEQ